MWCTEILLSTALKKALNSDQAQNCQTLDHEDLISKVIGQRKAACVAVADKGAAAAAATMGQILDHESDRVAGYASPDPSLRLSAGKA